MLRDEVAEMIVEFANKDAAYRAHGNKANVENPFPWTFASKILSTISRTHILLPIPEGWSVKEPQYESTGEQQGEVQRVGTITRPLTSDEWVEFVNSALIYASNQWTFTLSSGVRVVRKEG